MIACLLLSSVELKFFDGHCHVISVPVRQGSQMKRSHAPPPPPGKPPLPPGPPPSSRCPYPVSTSVS